MPNASVADDQVAVDEPQVIEPLVFEPGVLPQVLREIHAFPDPGAPEFLEHRALARRDRKITTNVELHGRCDEPGIELKLPYSPVDDRDMAREAKDFLGRSQPGGLTHGHRVLDRRLAVIAPPQRGQPTFWRKLRTRENRAGLKLLAAQHVRRRHGHGTPSVHRHADLRAFPARQTAAGSAPIKRHLTLRPERFFRVICIQKYRNSS
jgi:hypothetical protein